MAAQRHNGRAEDWFAGELSSPPAEIAAHPSEPPMAVEGLKPSVAWCVLLAFVSALGCAGEVVPCSVAAPKVESRQVLETAAAQQRTDDATALEFRIEEGGAATPNNAIRFRLRNVSSSASWVNARMFAESSIGEVSLEFAPSTAGKPVSHGCQVHPVPVEYLLLMPGSEISVVTVLHCLKFPTEGPWRVVAKYQDRKRHIPPVPPGASWFSGTLVSNELEFHARPTHAEPTPEK